MSVELGEPNGKDGTWTITETKCTAIKRRILIMRSGDKTKFINRLKTLDLTKRNGCFLLGKSNSGSEFDRHLNFRCLWMKC